MSRMPLFIHNSMLAPVQGSTWHVVTLEAGNQQRRFGVFDFRNSSEATEIIPIMISTNEDGSGTL